MDGVIVITLQRCSNNKTKYYGQVSVYCAKRTRYILYMKRDKCGKMYLKNIG
jgi:hypothetical protein